MTQISTHVNSPDSTAAPDDLYACLNIGREATQDEIDRAYKRLAKIFHPDANTGDADRFRAIRKAYDVLMNEQLRSVYDTTGIIAGDDPVQPSPIQPLSTAYMLFTFSVH